MYDMEGKYPSSCAPVVMEKVLELIAGQDVCLLFICIHAGLWVLICTVFYIVFVFFSSCQYY